MGGSVWMGIQSDFDLSLWSESYRHLRNKHRLVLSICNQSKDISFNKCFSFILKTFATKSGLFSTLCHGSKLSVISFHLGLQVIVTNKSGFPNFVTIDIASW